MLEGCVNDHAEQHKADMPKRHRNLSMIEFDFGLLEGRANDQCGATQSRDAKATQKSTNGRVRLCLHQNQSRAIALTNETPH